MPIRGCVARRGARRTGCARVPSRATAAWPRPSGRRDRDCRSPSSRRSSPTPAHRFPPHRDRQDRGGSRRATLSGGLAVPRYCFAQCCGCGAGGQVRERVAFPECIVIAVRCEPAQLVERRRRASRQRERLGMQEMQRWVRRRPLGQLSGELQEALRIASFARVQLPGRRSPLDRRGPRLHRTRAIAGSSRAPLGVGGRCAFGEAAIARRPACLLRARMQSSATSRFMTSTVCGSWTLVATASSCIDVATPQTAPTHSSVRRTVSEWPSTALNTPDAVVSTRRA